MAPRKGITEKYQQEWIKAYESGESMRQIAAQYGVSKTLIMQALNGVVKKRPKSPCRAYASKWLALYMNGWSKAEIAKKHNVSATVVGRILKEEGIPTIGEKKYLHLLPEMEKQYSEGLSFETIGQNLGISKQTICNYFKEYGIPARTYEESGQVYTLDFSELAIPTKKGAYDLGFLFSMGKLTEKNGEVIDVRISSMHEELVDYLLSSLHYNMPKEKYTYVDNTIAIGMRNLSLRTFLAEQGLSTYYKKQFPKLTKESQTEFYKGFLTERLYGRTLSDYTAIAVENKGIAEELVAFMNEFFAFENPCYVKEREGTTFLVFSTISTNQTIMKNKEQLNELPFPLKLVDKIVNEEKVEETNG